MFPSLIRQTEQLRSMTMLVKSWATYVHIYIYIMRRKDPNLNIANKTYRRFKAVAVDRMTFAKMKRTKRHVER